MHIKIHTPCTHYQSHHLSLAPAPAPACYLISNMSRARCSYHKLKQYHQNDDHQVSASAVEAALEAAKGVMRARASRSRLRWVPVRRKLRVRGFEIIRLRRYLKSRKLRLVKRVKGSWEKVMRRVRESRAHFGDLFAGNYLLLQVNPTPLKDGGGRWCDGGGGRLGGFVGDLRNPMYKYAKDQQQLGLIQFV